MRNIADTCSLLRAGALAACLLTFLAPAMAQDGPPLDLGNPIGGGVRKSLSHPKSPTSPIVDKNMFVVGRLEKVANKKTGSTRFALLDDNGQIAAFVGPTARFDLRRYLGKEIGVTAKSFSQSDGAAPYVLAEKITPMFVSEWNSSDAEEPRRLATRRRSNDRIRQVQHEEFMVDGQVVDGENVVLGDGWDSPTPMNAPIVSEPMVVEGEYIDDGSCGGHCEEHYGGGYVESYGPAGGGGCMTCGNTGCGPTLTCANCRLDPPTCGPPGWLWFRGEYLFWSAKGMDIPPLITQGTVDDAGVIGEPGTDIIYGDNDILTDGQSGFRLRMGGFWGPRRVVGWEAEYLSLDGLSETFVAESNGIDVISRPFFNINPRDPLTGDLDPPAANDAELVSFPGVLAGSVTATSFSNFESAGGRFRFNLCCKCRCTGCNGRCGYPPSSRVDMLVGYRHYGLDEGLTIVEDLTSLDPAAPGTFDITDSFRTRNDFNGGEFGVSWEGTMNRWTLEMLMNLAVGNTRQEVTISGETLNAPITTPATTPTTFEGGLLAQRTNSGTFSRNQFTMVPQLNSNLGFYLTPRLRVIVGYSLIYWGNVVRPGDQIDLDVNPDLLPPENVPFEGAGRPVFAFNQTDYWIQGLNLGLDYRW